MAKKQARRKSPARQTGVLAATLASIKRRASGEGLSDEAAERLREIVSVALMAVTAFVGVACATSGRGDNLCGSTGEALATGLLGAVGYAAWLLVGCLLLWSVALFIRADLPAFGVRAFGLLLCMVSTCALLAHLFGETPGRHPAGGYLGEYIDVTLRHFGGLGAIGTRIVLVALVLMSFVLATDILYYAALVGGARWVAEKGGEVREAARAAAEKRAREAEQREKEERRREREERAERKRQEAEERKAAKLRAKEEKEAAKARRAAEQAAIERKVEQTVEDGLDDDELDGSDDPQDALVEDEPLEEVDGDEADETDAEWDDEDYEYEDEDAEAGDAEGEELEYEDEPEEDDEEEGDEDLEEEDPDEEDYDEEFGDDEEDADADADEEEWIEYEDEAVESPDDDVEGDDDLAAAAAGPRVREIRDDELSPVSGDGTDDLVPRGKPRTVASAYVFPSEDLLEEQEAVDQTALDALLAEKTRLLEKTLESFKIEARCVEIQKGPVISMFEMSLAPGIKVERVRSLEDDLAIALKARTVRIVAPLPGKNTIGIEVPNPLREIVRMKALLHAREYDAEKNSLPIFLGRDAAGRPMVVDLAKMPHLLVAGATGSGKSVCLNAIIVSLLFKLTPEQVKLILIDPKMVEMSQFSDAPHLACPVVNDMKRAPGILDWAVQKMEDRYRLLARAGVRNIHSYNKLSDARLRARFGDSIDDEDFPRFLPFIVIIVDELADLMMTAAKDVETSITRLAAKSRAVGIHIILATQRPSTNVITGLIKANLPTRIAFMVSSKIDSRVILDSNGAEQLLGQGDMLFMSPTTSHLVRGQCTFISEEEVFDVMAAVKTESGPEYERELVQRRSDAERDPTEVDELYDAAARFVLDTRRGSASLLQRKFAIGYTRASRLIDLMAEEGLLGEFKGSQAREVQMSLEEWIELNPEARGASEEEEEHAGA
ncbi:MAG: DNA translocase FtsK 4TM domain-containing protein [Planctomycetes bacterium]|nr:DNA translocase FtsK 4TM domain-containing protein [Planctomycetota bacterium]